MSRAFFDFAMRSSLLALVVTAVMGLAAEPSGATPSDEDAWIDKPWNVRYVISVMSAPGWEALTHVGPKLNASWADGQRLVWEHLAEPAYQVKWEDDLNGYLSVMVMLVEFSKDGQVVTPPRFRGKKGRLDRFAYVLMTSTASAETYLLGKWFTGLGDVSTHWAPAICQPEQTPDPSRQRDPTYVYGPKYKNHETFGTFGCREWAYQLYDPGRPYIDVTSYMPRHVESEHQAYIRDFIGWARFGDSKPVIGQHGEEWYCLFDCPNGDKPGHIPDIKMWAARNGWPAPKPPTKSPTFPDPPAKQGTYP